MATSISVNAAPSFSLQSASGKLVVDVDGLNDYGHALALQPDGRILLAGRSYSIASKSYDFGVIRLNADGSLDTGFDGDGKAAFAIGDSFDGARSLTVQPDGKILLAGSSYNPGSGNYDFSVIRLNVDGTLDTSFGSPTGSPSSLGGTAHYTEGAAPVLLDASVAIFDTELAALDGGAGNYAGASITLSRQGGPSPEDLFFALGDLAFSDGAAVLSGVTVGSVGQADGTLGIAFNANASQARVDEVLSSIGYANTADAPPDSIRIDWTFRDGSGSDALSVTDGTTVHLLNTNDAPTVELPLRVAANEDDAAFTVDLLAGASDPDGDSLEVIDAGLLPGGITLSGNLLTVDPGHAAFQHLAAGATREILVDYRISDGIDSIGQILGLSIRGVNDAPRTTAVSLSGVENAPLLIPLVEDYVRDPDAGSQLHIGAVTAIDYAWAGDTASTALTHPITGQAVSLDVLAGTTVVSSDGKSLLLSPASELEWMSAGQKITATVHYSVEDERGAATTGSIAVTLSGSAADERRGADDLVGSQAGDVLEGGNGKDTLQGYGGSDALYGGSGDDELRGDKDVDYLYGDKGDDLLDGGAGNDVLFGGKGDDLLIGGAGSDHFVFGPRSDSDRILDFVKGVDTLHFVDFGRPGISAEAFVAEHVSGDGEGGLLIDLGSSAITLVGVSDTQGLAESISFVMSS